HGESSNAKEVSSDPFNIYGLLDKRTKEVRTTGTTTSIPYPPGFTPVNEISASIKQDRPPNRSEMSNSRVLEEVANYVDRSSSESINNGIKLKEGGSILESLEEMITVGQTMGFSMEGCTKDMEKIIGTQGEQIPNKQKLLLILVYAPQSVSYKRIMWSYLASLITSWNGESLIMGNFNEVRCIEERWGSVFNVHGANAFNSFISNSGLNDIQLEGHSFTWAHPSATKMSLPCFDDLVTKSWNSFVLDDSNGHSKDLKSKLSGIDKMLDQGGVTDDILLSPMEVLKQVHDVQSSNNRDIMQKVKIRWAIEGEENSKYFHAILDLESSISNDEIRTAVWGCGVDKSPGPDGFTFEFFRKYWAVVGPDFSSAVEWFFEHVSDYRPISLIGSLYKVVTKILATRLSLVISDLISDVQTVFLPNRQILDGPFI
nr:RNA-directed DNA polymerase, eukaryota [Tanacetum cinerariifolium]